MDHLGIGSAPIVGVSGGGPLATAAAFYLPDRISALALISAVPPPQAISGSGLELLVNLGKRPIAGRLAMRAARQLIRSRFGERAVLGRGLEGLDGVAMTPSLREALLAAMREGLQAGTAGALTDARIYGQSWGFALQDIAVSTTIWHGSEDPLVDPSAACAYAAIPASTLRICPGHGHYSLALGQTQAIMADLLQRASGAAPDPG